jgi:hypothetical protein
VSVAVRCGAVRSKVRDWAVGSLHEDDERDFPPSDMAVASMCVS